MEEFRHSFMPLAGQVSALVTMYSHEEDIDGAIEVFTQAIQWHQSHQVSKWGTRYKGAFLHKNKKLQ